MSEEIVRLEMGRQFPDLELQNVTHLGSGWEYDVYLVDEHLVARSPRYAEVARNLERAEPSNGSATRGSYLKNMTVRSASPTTTCSRNTSSSTRNPAG